MAGVFSFCAFLAALFFVGAVMDENGRKAGVFAAIFVACSIGLINLGGDLTSTSLSDCARYSSFADDC